MVDIFIKGMITLYEKFQIFEPRFNDEELEEEFNNFFHRYNLNSLFTNEHRAGSISVTYVDAKSVINTGGSYHETLKQFADYLTLGNDNQSYEEALFKLIFESRSFQMLMMKIKKLMDFINTIKPEHLFNLWNIVFYNKDIY